MNIQTPPTKTVSEALQQASKQASLLDQAIILFVDDETDILGSLKRLMRRTNSTCLFAQSGKDALALLEETTVDVVVSDMRMPQMNGPEFLAQVAEKFPETVRIVLSGHSDIEMVMDAVNTGKIWSYVSKPWDDNQLTLTIEQALFTQQIMAERALLRRSLSKYEASKKDRFEGFIGQSVPMQFIYSAIEQAAPSRASVYITGQSGTGKEIAARALHDLSPRADETFLALNCAAIPSELMESEIFGHLKGAFSGAVNNRDGAASLANGGTLFLDELSEMDISLQAKLLRFIQTGEFQRVGSSIGETVDIRFICASNIDPQQAIYEKKLREDLYYRLNVISIHLPPLSDRDDDVLRLAHHFMQRFAELEDKMVVGFSQDAEKLISNFGWPGNVRQLENTVHNLVVMAASPLISEPELMNALMLSKENLPKHLDKQDLSAEAITDQGLAIELSATDTSNKIRPLAEVEKVVIEQAIATCDGNVVKAANFLEVSPSTLYRKIQSWK